MCALSLDLQNIYDTLNTGSPLCPFFRQCCVNMELASAPRRGAREVVGGTNS